MTAETKISSRILNIKFDLPPETTFLVTPTFDGTPQTTENGFIVDGIYPVSEQTSPGYIVARHIDPKNSSNVLKIRLPFPDSHRHHILAILTEFEHFTEGKSPTPRTRLSAIEKITSSLEELEKKLSSVGQRNPIVEGLKEAVSILIESEEFQTY